MSSEQREAGPSQVQGTIKTLQGQAYQAVGAVSSDPSWTDRGKELQEQGEREVKEAQENAKAEATKDRWMGKAQSAFGFMTGDQEAATEGNKKAEQAEWKQAAADGTVPMPSKDRVMGKAESAMGMVTGDIDKQQQGNMRAEKAEWTKG
ncbi:hypothetical protein OIV83_004667 [Microbotryomycetes sp. JL201]|nr:hypothetical protein OIV83_004667 [Microbotryomycetes sp. JL201]